MLLASPRRLPGSTLLTAPGSTRLGGLHPDTQLTKNLDQPTLDFLGNQHGLQRLGKPEKVAELVAWLASDRSSYATGTYYAIDGGYLAR